METKNLMLGDWVLETEFDRNRPARIVAIVDKTRVLLETCALFTPINYIKPIPLTEKILKKNFNFDPNNSEGAFEHYWWSNDYFVVTITEYSDGIWEVEVDEKMADLPTWKMYVSHVHELQNAFSLCGIEKNIIL